MLVWAEPWLTPATACTSYARLDVICVAARLEPEANYPTLEALAAAANTALETAGFRAAQTSAPGPFEIAQVTYLAARVQVRQPVSLTATVPLSLGG